MKRNVTGPVRCLHLSSWGAEEIAPSVVLKCLSDLEVTLWELTTESTGNNRKHKQTVASTMLGPSDRLLKLIN